MAGAKHDRQKSAATSAEPRSDKPFGFVLVLRGLARAAIRLERHPAALRVLCVAAEYMNQDATCRIGQGTIAARLDISRQAVNRHLALLDKMNILVGETGTSGVTRRYYLDVEGLDNEREGQDRVDARRASKKEKPKPADNPSQRHARNEWLINERLGWVELGDALDRLDSVDEMLVAMTAYEASKGVEYREISGTDLYSKVYIERRPLTVVAGTDVAPAEFSVGGWASHPRFGVGQVSSVDDKWTAVAFASGERKVVSSFLEHTAPPVAPPSAPATSGIAGGAT